MMLFARTGRPIATSLRVGRRAPYARRPFPKLYGSYHTVWKASGGPVSGHFSACKKIVASVPYRNTTHL